MEFPHFLHPDESTRGGRMLAAGDVRVTMTDAANDEHITIRVKAILDNREKNGQRPEPSQNKNWVRVELERATHVFLEVPNAGGDFPDKVGTFYPRTGKFYPDRHADSARVQAAILVTHWLNGGYGGLEKAFGDDVARYDFNEESYCGKCGRQLTDPVSIERGIGPECFGQETGSQHQVKVKRVGNMSDEEWNAIQAAVPDRTNVRRVLSLLTDMSEEDQERVRHELNMWHSQRRQSEQQPAAKLFEDR